MTTSLIMPSWAFDEQTVQMTEDALENVRRTTGRLEVIAVHSGLKANLHKADRVIRIDPPQGWAASVNMGLLRARGDLLCVGSIDVYMPKNWLPAMVPYAKLGIVSPLDIKDGKRRVWDATERGSFWGAWFMFPRTVLAKIGYLDGYAMRRMADMDWAIRARKAGISTTRCEVEAKHIAPHHSDKAHPDPLHDLVKVAFRERHGCDYFGQWERMEIAA